jgi:hypothetical protein
VRASWKREEESEGKLKKQKMMTAGKKKGLENVI